MLFRYDNELDKVTNFQEIMLKNLKLIEIIVYNSPTSPLSVSGPTHAQKTSPAKNTPNSPILNLYYCPNIDKPSFVLHHSFKSTNLRFFNNIAVIIKNNEEKVGKLFILIAYKLNMCT